MFENWDCGEAQSKSPTKRFRPRPRLPPFFPLFSRVYVRAFLSSMPRLTRHKPVNWSSSKCKRPYFTILLFHGCIFCVFFFSYSSEPLHFPVALTFAQHTNIDFQPAHRGVTILCDDFKYRTTVHELLEQYFVHQKSFKNFSNHIHTVENLKRRKHFCRHYGLRYFMTPAWAVM